jgi:lycopene cyclase domain-containing protein
MTYFGFLLRFLVIPILILLILNRKEGQVSTYNFKGSKVWRGILIHVVLAVIYTTPWDNYLVATGVWFYSPRLVTGLVLGYVPIEEYTFFVLETILSGLWLWFISRRLSPPGDLKPSIKVRYSASIVLIICWIISILLFSSKERPFTYLSITLAWALPAILPQFLFGADILWHHRKLIALAILPLAIYLSITDSIAIASGIWTIDPSQSTRLLLGVLPVEEALFFLITNILIGFGLTLLLVKESSGRLQEIRHLTLDPMPVSKSDQLQK